MLKLIFIGYLMEWGSIGHFLIYIYIKSHKMT